MDAPSLRPRPMSDKRGLSDLSLSLLVANGVVSLKPVLVLVFPLMLAACATESTGPMSVGNGTFVVSRQAGAFPSGREPLLVDAIKEAQAKCASSGKSVKLISQTENPGPYIMGNYPKATVVYSCD